MTHSLLLATEEEREWMIDRDGGMWFDWQNGEWRDMPDHWMKMDNWGIILEIMHGKRKSRGSAYERAVDRTVERLRQRVKHARLQHKKASKKSKYKPRPAPDLARFLEIAKQINKTK